MTPELIILTYAALLQFAQLAISIVFNDTQTGIKYGASARETPRPLTGITGRFGRALTMYHCSTNIPRAARIKPLSTSSKSSYAVHMEFICDSYSQGDLKWQTTT